MKIGNVAHYLGVEPHHCYWQTVIGIRAVFKLGYLLEEFAEV